MPRVYLSDQDRACHRLATCIRGEKKLRKVNDTELAEEHGISQPAMSWKIRNEKFSFQDFVFFVQKFGFDDDTIHYILGTKGG